MKTLSPIVWLEGMHLAQHHFQHLGRYIEDSTAFLHSVLAFRPYGYVSLELDRDAVANGTVALLHARGIMPDGLPFELPPEPLPDVLPLRDRFSPTADGHVVSLTIPRYRPGRANCRLDGEDPSAVLRYRVDRVRVVDDTTGMEEQVLDMAVKNFRLELDPPDSDDEVSLPLARVIRDGSGSFAFDETFVPPSLQIGASARLMDHLGRLIEILDQKSQTLRGQRGGAEPDYSARELAGFWLSHAIHSSLAPLRHLRSTRSESPERLYQELARLAGALCTFSTSMHPDDIPAYEHDRLGPVFAELDGMIRRGLEVVIPTGALTISLRPMLSGESVGAVPAEDRHIASLVLTAEVKDRRAFGRTQWYLGVRSGATAAVMASRVPELVKVCSAKHIVRLVREAYTGLTLEHVPSPPAAISPRLGTEYFRLTRTDPCWASMSETGEIGVYVPGALPSPELDLVVARQD